MGLLQLRRTAADKNAGVGQRLQQPPSFLRQIHNFFFDSERLAKLETLFGRLLYHLQWLYVLFVALPLGVISRGRTKWRNWAIQRLGVVHRAHERKVATVQRQVREWNKAGRRQRLCTGRPAEEGMSWHKAAYKRTMLGLKTYRMRDVLEISPDRKWVRVEPMVTMGQLIDYLIPRGYTLPVVPGYEHLTVGGLINGAGVGTSGRKYGLFQHICLQYEIVTSQGELIVSKREAKTEHQSLFYGIPWSHGSLGMLVAATLRIIPAQNYVRLTYQACFSRKDLAAKLREEATRNGNEFVEALLFDQNTSGGGGGGGGVVMSGQFAEQIPKNAVENAMGRWYKPWFFTHVEGILKSARVMSEKTAAERRGAKRAWGRNESEVDAASTSPPPPVVEYIPLRDYYFRHERSQGWRMAEWLPFANSLWFRYLLGWAMPPKSNCCSTPATHSMLGNPLKNFYSRRWVCQDLIVPASALEETLTLLDHEYRVYPVLLSPFNLPSQPGLLRNRSGMNNLCVHVGIYGQCRAEQAISSSSSYSTNHPMETSTRRVEKFLRGVQGMQMLHADCYQTCAEFWEMFDASLYDWLRAKYDCKAAFPSVYEKIARQARE